MRIECQKNEEVRMGEGFAGREAPFEDHHIWRLLLARLHPDAGGDHELFLFAYALKERAYANSYLEDTPALDDDRRRTKRSAEPFLRTWHDAMGGWATCNRETLKRFVFSETPLAPAGD
jgi:hypothetical protein